MKGTPSPLPISTRLRKIAELARQAPELAFTTLAHHIDVHWMAKAYHLTRKDGATGVDHQTATEYSQNLVANLKDLIDRFKSGRYKAPPVKRVYIPKGDGSDKKRPIGIPTIEDKILQRSVVMVLEAIYEQDFYDCSYGFRPDKSAHQMLQAVYQTLTEMKGGWVLEADIKSYFDTIDHGQLRDCLDKRVCDGVIRRVIDKWLKAGIWEDDQRRDCEEGTPQGGVISPLLANIYLHYVVDEWFHKDVLPRMKGKAYLFRYADDFIMCFESENDARRVMEALPKRLKRFGLEIHPEKTRLIPFKKPEDRKDKTTSGSFDLLGFTHCWGKSRIGRWIIKQQTSKKRINRTLTRIKHWLKTNRHKKLSEQRKTLTQKLTGHYAYFGITGNISKMQMIADKVTKIWFKWINRRSQRKSMTWNLFNIFLRWHPLPKPRIVHSIYKRHTAKLWPEEPDASIGHVRI